MSVEGLLAILDVVATGKIAILPTIVPLFGLISAKAVVSHDILEKLALVSKPYSSISWLKGISQAEFSEERDLLIFQRWK